MGQRTQRAESAIKGRSNRHTVATLSPPHPALAEAGRCGVFGGTRDWHSCDRALRFCSKTRTPSPAQSLLAVRSAVRDALHKRTHRVLRTKKDRARKHTRNEASDGVTDGRQRNRLRNEQHTVQRAEKFPCDGIEVRLQRRPTLWRHESGLCGPHRVVTEPLPWGHAPPTAPLRIDERVMHETEECGLVIPPLGLKRNTNTTEHVSPSANGSTPRRDVYVYVLL